MNKKQYISRINAELDKYDVPIEQRVYQVIMPLVNMLYEQWVVQQALIKQIERLENEQRRS